MTIVQTTQLADALHNNVLLLPIINRFGIQLGFGNKTIEQICQEHQVNVHFFLEIVNSFIDKDYFPQSELQAFPLKSIINYIIQSHHYYVNLKIPQIKELIELQLKNAGDRNRKSYELIRDFFTGYSDELIEHIDKEEKDVHPYILAIDSAYQSGQITAELKSRVKKESIQNYADDHSNVEDKLFDLKNLIIKYLPPSKDYTTSNAILFELFRLERDLNDHSRIEEKVLVPKVQMLENLILETKA